MIRLSPLSLLLPILLALAGCKSEDVKPRPVSDFTFSVVSATTTEKVIQFTNTSKNADRYQWLTASGIATSTKDLQITFSQNGRFNVSLTAKNDVGEDTKTQSVVINDLATTGDVIFWSQIGDKGNTVVSINGVVQGTITKYSTNGAAPSCGLQGFVTVTLAPGTYPFTAKSEGTLPLSWSGSINVIRGKCTTWELRR